MPFNSSSKALPKEFVNRWKQHYPSYYQKLFYYNNSGIQQVIRCNSLKILFEDLRKLLFSKNIILHPINSIPDAAYVENKSNISLGSSHEYLKGLYAIQGLASQLPALFFTFRNKYIEQYKVLDMTAAPGNKTCQLANILQNKGIIIALEKSSARTGKLIANISRLGVVNVLVLQANALGWVPRLGLFSHILLDAPCTGSGSICKRTKSNWNKKIEDIFRMKELQKKLLITGLKALIPGGELIYSTCSIEPEENEEVIIEILDKIDQDIELENLRQTFNNLTYLKYFVITEKRGQNLNDKFLQFMPSEFHEGFFIAKFRRTSK